MGAFQYVAVDTAGQERQGILEGDSVKQIRQMLREQSLLPVSVEEVQRKEAVSSQVSRFSSKRTKSMSAHELALVTRQLSTLVRAGLPLEESLLAVSEQTEQAHVRSVFMGVRASGQGSGTSCRLHRSPGTVAQSHHQRNAVSRTAVHRVLRYRDADAHLCGAQDRQAVR